MTTDPKKRLQNESARLARTINPSVRIIDGMRMMKRSACHRRSCLKPNAFPAVTHNRDFRTDAFLCAQKSRLARVPQEDLLRGAARKVLQLLHERKIRFPHFAADSTHGMMS
jgi:hypothetical protein